MIYGQISISFPVYYSFCKGKSIDSAYIPINFEGNRYISTSELESLVGAKHSSTLKIWRDDTALINSLLISKLDKIFKLFYKSEGFYKAKISHTINRDGVYFL